MRVGSPACRLRDAARAQAVLTLLLRLASGREAVRDHAGVRQLWPLPHAGGVRGSPGQAVRDKHDSVDCEWRRFTPARARVRAADHRCSRLSLSPLPSVCVSRLE